MRSRRPLFLAFLILICGAMARANVVFTSANIFGDSLSDVGNLFTLTKIFTPNNVIPDPTKYYNGRMSNGPLWVEYLLPKLGLPVPTAALLGGTDYAYAGAFANGAANSIPPSLRDQVTSYLQSGRTAKPTDLFILWAGANDFLNGSPDPSTIADAVLGQVQILENAGARQFLILNMPPLGQTPDFKNNTDQQKAQANATAQVYNQTLAAGLGALQNSLGAGGKVYQLDVYGLFEDLIANPTKYHLTNVTDAFPGALNDPAANSYLFWDTLHPTTAADMLLADAAATAIPDPATLSLFALCSAVLLRRRRSCPFSLRPTAPPPHLFIV